jgi:hypothetical protein
MRGCPADLQRNRSTRWTDLVDASLYAVPAVRADMRWSWLGWAALCGG